MSPVSLFQSCYLSIRRPSSSWSHVNYLKRVKCAYTYMHLRKTISRLRATTGQEGERQYSEPTYLNCNGNPAQHQIGHGHMRNMPCVQKKQCRSPSRDISARRPNSHRTTDKQTTDGSSCEWRTKKEWNTVYHFSAKKLSHLSHFMSRISEYLRTAKTGTTHHDYIMPSNAIMI